MSDLQPPKPGETCALCARRVNHPKTATSPKSSVKSFRVPEDEADSFAENLARATLAVGLTSGHKYPTYRFIEFMADEVLRDPDRWAGAYLREYSGVGE